VTVLFHKWNTILPVSIIHQTMTETTHSTCSSSKGGQPTQSLAGDQAEEGRPPGPIVMRTV
jgi:hypothetical protein